MLARLETLFLQEAPSALRWLAAGLALIGLAGGVVLAMNGEDGVDPRHLRFGLVLWVPAAICLSLAWAISARHIAAVPLSFLLAALSLWPLRGVPRAMDGLTGPVPLEWMAWVVGALEFAAIVLFLAVVTRLARAGAFRRRC